MSDNQKVPHRLLQILRWFCPDELYEGIEGDLVEQYEADTKRWNKSKARRRLLLNVVRLVHPVILLRNKFAMKAFTNTMISNYIRLTVRNIRKRKLYTLINTVGLSVAIAFCLLIALYLRDELSFDQFHANKDRIYRIDVREYNYWDPKPDPSENYNNYSYCQLGLRDILLNECPTVEYTTRFLSGWNGIVKSEDQVFSEKLALADADFFKMFSFQLLGGSVESIFKEKGEVVITSDIAQKYFGDKDPIGSTLRINIEGQEENAYTITGLIENPPANSSLDFKILIPIQNRPRYDQQVTSLENFNTPTFVQLKPNATAQSFDDNLLKITETHLGDILKRWRAESNVPDDIDLFHYYASALPSIHLNKDVTWHKASNPQYSIILSSIAILILIIACINYISLSLTSSTSRRIEVGMRKAMGALRRQLIFQFSIESVILTFLSLLVALGLVWLFLPFFNSFTSKQILLSLLDALKLFGVGVFLSLIVGLIAGSYPAMILSGFRPVQILKNQLGKVKIGFTRPLVVLQFALSSFLIISSWIMFSQMEFVTTKDLGYDKDHIIVIPTQTGWGYESERALDQYKNAISNEPQVLSVAGTSIAFNKGWSLNGYSINGVKRSAYIYGVDHGYIPLLNIKLIEGRNFDPANPADSSAIIVNEALVKDMGWTDPLNEYLNYREDSIGPGAKVIGVVKDYHYRSLESHIEPMMLSMDKDFSGHLGNIMVKVSSEDIQSTLKKLDATWRSLFPDKPFEFTFLEDDVAMQYESYARWMKIMSLSTGFAILVSCLGLFGLAGINAVNRTKEVGIRKVMGAELSNIFALLNKQFFWLSLIAFALAIPFSWYAMNKWLAGFEYRIEIDWTLFAVSAAIGTSIALLTVSYHAFKAAMTNPAETLKYE